MLKRIISCAVRLLSARRNPDRPGAEVSGGTREHKKQESILAIDSLSSMLRQRGYEVDDLSENVIGIKADGPILFMVEEDRHLSVVRGITLKPDSTDWALVSEVVRDTETDFLPVKIMASAADGVVRLSVSTLDPDRGRFEAMLDSYFSILAEARTAFITRYNEKHDAACNKSAFEEGKAFPGAMDGVVEEIMAKESSVKDTKGLKTVVS